MPVALHVSFKADTIFLMGLHSTHTEDLDADIALRQLLVRHKLPHQVLYGTHEECLVQAINVIRSRLQDVQGPGSSRTIPQENRAESIRPWVWICDKCSDPQCEHRLLTVLLASRSAAVTGQLP